MMSKSWNPILKKRKNQTKKPQEEYSAYVSDNSNLEGAWVKDNACSTSY